LKSLTIYAKGSFVRAYNQTSNVFMVGIPADKLEPGIIYSYKFNNKHVLNIQFSAPKHRMMDQQFIELFETAEVEYQDEKPTWVD
jgi:hypothetical protein